MKTAKCIHNAKLKRRKANKTARRSRKINRKPKTSWLHKE